MPVCDGACHIEIMKSVIASCKRTGQIKEVKLPSTVPKSLAVELSNDTV